MAVGRPTSLFLKCSVCLLGFAAGLGMGASSWFGFQRSWISSLLVAVGLLILAALSGLATLGPASAQDRRQDTPGEFDYYVLSLSWSPSFCEEAEERGNGRRSQAQCGGRPFSFVVHGLWPQYEHGFPEYCQRPSPRLDRNIMTSMLDLMPAPGLIFNEWDKHGTCSGLDERRLFRNHPQGARRGENSRRNISNCPSRRRLRRPRSRTPSSRSIRASPTPRSP